jgi:hypothetical protein
MTANEILKAEGHTSDGGVCEKCWSAAAALYAMGYGDYESQTAAYYAVMEDVQAEAVKRAALTTEAA